jgi:hypothetical protein
VERLLSNLAFKSFATRDNQEAAGYAKLMDIPEGHPNSPTDGHLKLPHLS